MKLLVLSIFFPFFLLAPNTEKELIQWNAERKLTWKDFKSKKTRNNQGMVAETHWSWDWEEVIIDNEYILMPICYFNTQGSWTTVADPYILEHEQLHFDIGELYVRKLRKTLIENPSFFNDSEKLRRVSNKYFNRCINAQRLYDKETNHSIIKLKQNEWNMKIHKELLKYNLFDF